MRGPGSGRSGESSRKDKMPSLRRRRSVRRREWAFSRIVSPTRPQTTWWLDSGALPDRLLWARLVVAADDSAVVLDCDGRYHRFLGAEAAKLWLLEDEYSLLSHLVDEGEISPEVEPPSAPNDALLVPLMMRANDSLWRSRQR